MKRFDSFLPVTGTCFLLAALVGCGDDDGLTDSGADAFSPDAADAAVDPCEGVDLASRCTEAAAACRADTLVRCAPNANGCLVVSEEVCEGGCDDSGAVAMCGGDACLGVSTCVAEGRACDADALVVCAPNVDGCLIEETTDCAATGSSCGDVDGVAACTGSCDAASVSGIVLNCDSAPVMGDTSTGTSLLSGYCGSGSTDYAGPEVFFTFADERAALVTVTFERTSGSADMDVFVLNGGDTAACSPATPCLATSERSSATEEVQFTTLPGRSQYIAYDVFNLAGPGESAEFTATVTCEFTECGNSSRESSEDCDDGNTEDGDGCSALCELEPGYVCQEEDGLSTCALSCPDGVVNGDDECDDAGAVDGDGCSATCTIEDGYTCDENAEGLSVCELACGNGSLEAEECDDGDTEDGDGCSASCTIEDGYVCSTVDGTSVCRLSCGDGTIDASEQCDDGNALAGDGCSATCQDEDGFVCFESPSVCIPAVGSYDGVLEDTDTAWARPASNCDPGSTDTVFESFTYTNATAEDQLIYIYSQHAFDGFLFVYDGAVDPSAPTTGCLLGNDDYRVRTESRLANVSVLAGESITVVVSSFADDGRGRFVTSLVEVGAACGDGVIFPQVGEACDDAAAATPGCSDICQVEAGYICTGEPSICGVSTCGDGTIDFNEVCDDGNTVDGDGCEADCETAVLTGAVPSIGPTWVRADEDCTAGAAGGFLYSVEPFTWTGAEDATLVFTAQWGMFDGYLHAYSMFDALDPTMGCLDGDDDFGGGTARSQVTATMSSSDSIELVMSSFRAGISGSWTVNVTRAP